MAKKQVGGLMAKMLERSTVKDAAILNQSKIYDQAEMIPTEVPMLNVAFSADPDGGVIPGLTSIAGPPKHFKSLFALIAAKAFMDKYPEGILLFYDNEFGTPRKYFESLNFDVNRILHTPIENIEKLKNDIMVQLNGLERGDKVFIIIDSVGNVPSIKEIEDALDGKQVADMTRARALKSLFRMVTPILTIKDIPLISINHVYKEMGMFPKTVMSGGQGGVYSSSTIWFISREKEKDGTEVTGYDFKIRIEKSRYVKEGTVIPINVMYEGGVNKWSGLLENAIDAGYIAKVKKGVYQRVDENGEFFGEEFSENEINHDSATWVDLLAKQEFKDFLKNKYTLGAGELLQNQEEVELTDDTGD